MPNISYVVEGKGEIILLLHGWGQNKEMMMPLVEGLKYKYKCVVVDLPGFGESSFNFEKDLKDYVLTLRNFLKNNNLLPKTIIGHSFGGKVAMEYYLQYQDISNLIIIASPLLKPKRTLKYYFEIYKYKIKKKLKFKTGNIGSEDYKNCSKEMKSFFVKIVNKHFDKNLKNVKIPTLLIWGKNDEKVPLIKAKKLNKKINNSRLCVINGGHFAYLENIEFTRLVIQVFLRRNSND